jgi:hypothetical protein
MNLLARTTMTAVVVILVASLPSSAASATPSPYRATLTMQHGLLFSNSVNDVPKRGVQLTAAQSQWVTIKSAAGLVQWGVWRPEGNPETIAVRSVNGGATWVVAGPMLATDWVGGSLYYVSKVFSEGPGAVVMVSNSVIDVSTDGGRQWYQYLNSADNWDIALYPTNGATELRISGASYSQLPKGSYALYVLNVAHHLWHRLRQTVT